MISSPFIARPPISIIKLLYQNIDLVVLFGVIFADIRVLKDSTVVSFTLFELFIWGYCAPVVFSSWVIDRCTIPPCFYAFLSAVTFYMGWLVVASVLGLAFRDSTVAENTKSVFSNLIMLLFLFMRVRDVRALILSCNLYIIYSVAACCVGLLQYKFGQPYFRELVEGTEWKLDVAGTIVDTPVVGFSGHPNEFAATILPGVTLAIFKLILEMRHNRLRPITLVVSIILLAGMAISQARGETISMCAGIVFIISPLGKKRSFIIKLGFASCIIMVLTIYGLHRAALGAPEAETIEVRYLLWVTALHGILSDLYILCFGGGTSYMIEWSLPTAGWQFVSSHNTWIDQVIFFGVPGLALYLRLWQQFFRSVEATTFVGINEKAMLDGLRASLVALMINYFFEPYANDVLAASQLFYLMGIAICIVSIMGVSASTQPHPVGSDRFVPARIRARP